MNAYSLLQQNVEGTHDLLATAQAQHQVQSALLLDVVVRQSAAVLELLARENQPLLVGRDEGSSESRTFRKLSGSARRFAKAVNSVTHRRHHPSRCACSCVGKKPWLW